MSLNVSNCYMNYKFEIDCYLHLFYLNLEKGFWLPNPKQYRNCHMNVQVDLELLRNSPKLLGMTDGLIHYQGTSVVLKNLEKKNNSE